jgi:hypothetical protein
MRAQHSPHFLTAYPVYSSAFLSPSHLVLGGGGGASRTGIKNKLVSWLVYPKCLQPMFETESL